MYARFNVPAFVGKAIQFIFDRWGNVYKDKIGKQAKKTAARNKVPVNPAFLEKGKLSSASAPQDYLKALLPCN